MSTSEDNEIAETETYRISFAVREDGDYFIGEDGRPRQACGGGVRILPMFYDDF